MKIPYPYLFLALCSAIVVLWALSLAVGSVAIPVDAVRAILWGETEVPLSWQRIVLEVRLPQATTAILAGASLALAGLLLQTLFSNPLADPSILGINAGASLGVAVVTLVTGGAVYGLLGNVAISLAAITGTLPILLLLSLLSVRIRSNTLLLIVGLMLSYITSSVITLLNFWATPEQVFAFTLWGMGDFSGVTMSKLPYFCAATLLLIGIGLLLIKPLNALLLGEYYAANLGVPVKRIRLLLLLVTGGLAAVTTAYCGPIAFIGLSVPHMARLVLGTANHQRLVPFTLLLGSLVALVCNLLTVLPTQGTLPLSAITPLVGAPIILYVILQRHKINYFTE